MDKQKNWILYAFWKTCYNRIKGSNAISRLYDSEETAFRKSNFHILQSVRLSHISHCEIYAFMEKLVDQMQNSENV